MFADRFSVYFDKGFSVRFRPEEEWFNRKAFKLESKNGEREALIEHEIKPMKAMDWRLLEMILRHLSVIGVPVDASVICECPDISIRLNQIIPQRELQEPVVALALEILAARGLAFRFLTHDDRSQSCTDRDRPVMHRYQVHRQLQLYIHRKLGSQILNRRIHTHLR